MTPPVHHRLTIKNVQDRYFRVFFLADEILRMEEELVAFLADISKDRIELTFGYRSLKRFCQRSLGFTKTQSHRIVTEVAKFHEKRQKPPDHKLLPETLYHAEGEEQRLLKRRKEIILSREHLRDRLEELEAETADIEERLDLLDGKIRELRKAQHLRELDEISARAVAVARARDEEI